MNSNPNPPSKYGKYGDGKPPPNELDDNQHLTTDTPTPPSSPPSTPRSRSNGGRKRRKSKRRKTKRRKTRRR